MSPASADRGCVAVIIPAKNEQDRIARTVRAAAELPGVDVVLVIDDGSVDATGEAARAAGALVVRHGHNRGKGAAMETGAGAVRLLDDAQDRANPRHLLFLDADLMGTAGRAAPLLTGILDGETDMTIAAFPADRAKIGGHGFVVRLASDGIRRATGWRPEQPLNGQRCLTRQAFDAALPLAHGFGVETALTIDLLQKGFRVAEVEVPLEHRATGGDWRSQLHRGRQFADVARALAERELHPRITGRLRRARQRVAR